MAVLVLVTAAPPLAAQSARLSSFAIDSAVSVDNSIDQTGDVGRAGVVMDAVISAGIGRHFEAILRPFVQRLPSGEWNRQIWIAALRFQRPGPVSVRIDGGLISPPVGMANTILRPQLNPALSPPSSLFQGLPAIGGPRATLIGALYPYGVTTAAWTNRWDVRVALIDTSPVRARRVFARVNPPQFANLVVGAGVTPVVGLRLGGSVTHGGWVRAGELPTVTQDHDATVVTLETEFSFRHTRLMGEWVRDTLHTDSGPARVTGWFVLGQQTLTPRWFAAARVERTTAPFRTPLLSVEQSFTGAESVLGYRLTPEVTLRAGYRGRRGFGVQAFDHAAVASAVWWKRWL